MYSSNSCTQGCINPPNSVLWFNASIEFFDDDVIHQVYAQLDFVSSNCGHDILQLQLLGV